MRALMHVLICQYFLLAAGFAVARDYARCGYFVAAAAINISVLFMR